MSPIEGSQKQVSRWSRGSRPIWLVVLLWSLMSLAARPVIHWWDPVNVWGADVELLVAGFAGTIVGQVCFVALLAGLRWQPWSVGYGIGVVIVFIGLLAWVTSFWFTDEHDNEAFLSLAFLPAFLLALASPLFIFRFAFGWRLVACGEPAPTRETVRLEDLFSFTAITAASLVLLRLPPVILEDEEGYWPTMLAFCGILFVIGLLVLPICIRLALGTASRVTAIAGLLLFALLVPTCIFAITQAFMPREVGWDERINALKEILATCGGASVSLGATLFVLSRCGMSLARAAKAPPESSTAIASRQRGTRWLTAGAIVVAVLVSAGLARFEQHRKDIDSEIARLSEFAERLDGDIESWDRTIIAITLGERATDRDLDQFFRCNDVESIDLSGSAVSDLGLAKLEHFPKTTSLALRGTQVTDDGLVAVNALRKLAWLELSSTKIVGSGFANVERSDELIILELTDTPIDDAGCRELDRFSELAHLSLAGTRVTDNVFPHLKGLTKLNYLAIDRTDVTGDGLSDLTRLSWLTLDGTKVDDASISHIVALKLLDTLDLSHTAISDTAVERLRELPLLLDLNLTGTAVNGEGFRLWVDQSRLNILTLLQTALNDAGVKHLKHLSPLDLLDVSGTQLSDACLSDLAEMEIEQLNLSNTKITAAGLLAAGMVKVSELMVAPNQFTDAEIQQLETQFTVTKLVGPGDETDGE